MLLNKTFHGSAKLKKRIVEYKLNSCITTHFIAALIMHYYTHLVVALKLDKSRERRV